MTEFFMGQELTQQRLPPNSPRPAITSPDGVILTDVAPDGWTRRYLYTSLAGRTPEEVLVSETPPAPAPAPPELQRRRQPMPPQPMIQQRTSPMDLRSMSGPTAFMHKMVPLRRLGQAFATPPGAPTAAPAAPPPPPAAPAIVPGVCPGPIEMPDQTRINPNDPITLKALCEILPLLMSAFKVSPAAAAPPPTAPVPGRPGGPIPLSGTQGAPVPGAGFPGFGPAGGSFGGGGGGGPTPTPGPLGPIASPTVISPNQGPPGPPGPAGPAGVGGALDFRTKTDGDFTAGPGAFIPVPGTLFSFVQGSDGPALFLLQAVFGCSGANAQSDQIGIRIDGGAPIPLTVNLAHNGLLLPGAIFLWGATSVWPVALLIAGTHTVEIMLRGLAAGEFCAAAGLGLPATVSANPSIPLSLIALHR